MNFNAKKNCIKKTKSLAVVHLSNITFIKHFKIIGTVHISFKNSENYFNIVTNYIEVPKDFQDFTVEYYSVSR